MKGLYRSIRNAVIGAATFLSIVGGVAGNSVAGEKDYGFRIYTDKKVYHAGDEVKLYIASDKRCNHVYILDIDSEGHIYRLYPNPIKRNVYLEGGVLKQLPEKDSPIHIVVAPLPNKPTPQEETYIGICSNEEIKGIENIPTPFRTFNVNPPRKEVLDEILKKENANYDIDSTKYLLFK